MKLFLRSRIDGYSDPVFIEAVHESVHVQLSASF